MMMIRIVILMFAVASKRSFADKPCQARQIQNQSVVCVCTEDYCDSITITQPHHGNYHIYRSSQEGLRLEKRHGRIRLYDSSKQYDTEINVNPLKTYQTIEGFGGAVTDAVGINWLKLTPPLQDTFVESYFGERGIGYNMIRVPIAGCDFSTHPYAYNELPINDAKLSNYSLTAEDFTLKIPLIKLAMSASSEPIHVLASAWSPPAWMKTNNKITGVSLLKPEYFQTYADYHLLFLQKYAENGVPVWGITTTDEPINGVLAQLTFNSLGFTPDGMGQWIAENLGPTIRKSKFKDTKILGVDDQRYLIPYWYTLVVNLWPAVDDYLDGLAVHWYTNKVVPPSAYTMVNYTNKFIMSTEACSGFELDKPDKVILGSWERAEDYISDIITSINSGLVGWIDWNLCLDSQGGPNWVDNFVDSPVIVTSSTEFVKQPMFYAMAHVAKFVPRGSKRIDLSIKGDSIEAMAFVLPDHMVVVIVFNRQDEPKKVRLQLFSKQIVVTVDARSISTVQMP